MEAIREVDDGPDDFSNLYCFGDHCVDSYRENGICYVCACGNMTNTHVDSLREKLVEEGFIEPDYEVDEIFAKIENAIRKLCKKTKKFLKGHPEIPSQLVLLLNPNKFDLSGPVVALRADRKARMEGCEFKIYSNPDAIKKFKLAELSKYFPHLDLHPYYNSSFRCLRI